MPSSRFFLTGAKRHLRAFGRALQPAPCLWAQSLMVVLYRGLCGLCGGFREASYFGCYEVSISGIRSSSRNLHSFGHRPSKRSILSSFGTYGDHVRYLNRQRPGALSTITCGTLQCLHLDRASEQRQQHSGGERDFRWHQPCAVSNRPHARIRPGPWATEN